MFELIFLFILSKFLNKMIYYKHQYFSIIIMIITELISFVFNFINEGILMLFIILFINLFLSFLRALLYIYLKRLMEYKYISPYKITFIFGILNFSIVIIVYIIVSFCECKNNYCKTLYNDKNYFANILEIFNVISIFLFFIFLLRAFMTVLNYAIIRYFSVCHSFIYFQLCMLIGILENQEDISKRNSYFFIKLTLLIIDIFFSLIFLEIIEVNICGISYNTKIIY